MATAAVYDGAAARTFGIPELCEQILIHVGHLSSSRNDFEPLRALFVLQRVNSAFQSVIATSRTLRRLMLLENDSDDVEVDDTDLWYSNNLAPTWWLLENLMDRGYAHWYTQSAVQKFSLLMNLRSKANFCWWRHQTFRTPTHEAAAAHEKAPWKNIKLAKSSRGTRSTVLRQCIETTVGRCGMQVYLIDLDSQRTLGDLYAFYERIMDCKLRNLRRLTHIYARHEDRIDRERVESLATTEALAADEAIVRYRKFKSEAKANNGPEWKPEQWAIGSRDKKLEWIEVCAYCTGEEREGIFPSNWVES